ncbi:hypothetical protein ACLQ24_06860 [Micromonospora sp. DT4]|uniref:hypothetical protein n=1 Tax=Micromonospora sp. DT4 TaxID=3393438 RepID=UPI003CF915E3
MAALRSVAAPLAMMVLRWSPVPGGGGPGWAVGVPWWRCSHHTASAGLMPVMAVGMAVATG